MAATKKYKYFTKALTCPDGTRKYIRAKTQRELNKKVEEAKLELHQGVNISNNCTVSELAQTWVDIYKRPNLRANSLKDVLGRLNNHIIPYIGNKRVRDVKAMHIADIMNNHGFPSRDSNVALLSDLRSIFNLAIDNGFITRNPVPLMLKATGETYEHEEPLSREDSRRLLDYLRSTKKKPMSSYLFTLIATTTGMRRGEILGLTWDCIDFTNDIIEVKQQIISLGKCAEVELTSVLKTKNAYRKLPMPPELHKALALEKLRGRSKFCVCTKEGNPINCTRYTTYIRQWKIASDALNLGHVHAHRFRHAYATWLVGSGLDPKQVQYLMGHSDLDMTLGLYAHYEAEQRREETNQQVRDITSLLFAV